MKPYYQDSACTIYHGDCREILPTLPKVDLVLTDPPYGIGADNRTRILSRSNATAATDYGESDWDSKTPDFETITRVLCSCDKAIIWGGNFFTLPQRLGRTTYISNRVKVIQPGRLTG